MCENRRVWVALGFNQVLIMVITAVLVGVQGLLALSSSLPLKTNLKEEAPLFWNTENKQTYNHTIP